MARTCHEARGGNAKGPDKSRGACLGKETQKTRHDLGNPHVMLVTQHLQDKKHLGSPATSSHLPRLGPLHLSLERMSLEPSLRAGAG